MGTGVRKLILILCGIFLLANSASLFPQRAILYVAVLSNQNYVVGAENAPAGLVVSPDLGKTWGRLCWPNCRAFDVAVDHSSDGRIVYIAAGNGVLKTENGGAMWRITTGWRVTEVQDVEVCRLDPDWIAVGTAYGIFVSEDAGKRWEERNIGLTVSFCSALEMDREDENRIWVGTEKGLFISENRGKEWHITGLEDKAIRTIAQSPDKGKLLLAGTEDHGIYRSVDRGKSWVMSNSKMRSLTVYDIAFNPDRSGKVYAGTHGQGVYRSLNQGITWKRVNKGLRNQVVHSVAVLPREGKEIVFAGTVNGGIYRSNNEGLTWKLVGLDGAQVWEIYID